MSMSYRAIGILLAGLAFPDATTAWAQPAAASEVPEEACAAALERLRDRIGRLTAKLDGVQIPAACPAVSAPSLPEGDGGAELLALKRELAAAGERQADAGRKLGELADQLASAQRQTANTIVVRDNLAESIVTFTAASLSPAESRPCEQIAVEIDSPAASIRVSGGVLDMDAFGRRLAGLRTQLSKLTVDASAVLPLKNCNLRLPGSMFEIETSPSGTQLFQRAEINDAMGQNVPEQADCRPLGELLAEMSRSHPHPLPQRFWVLREGSSRKSPIFNLCENGSAAGGWGIVSTNLNTTSALLVIRTAR